MTTGRIEAVSRPAPKPSLSIAAALRERLNRGYSLADFRADLMAGIVVGIVALPLSMALAIASGVPPQHGLYTAIVAGSVIALLGGSQIQVSGPTAAFVVILAPISAQYGVGGLALATLIAGVILAIMGVARLGSLIQFVPYPVTTGFTAGIAVVIATLQVKDFLGLTVTAHSEHYLGKVAALGHALPTMHWPDVAVGVLTLAILLLWPRLTRRVPAALIALTVAAAGAWLATRLVPGFDVATIASRFSYTDAAGVVRHGIPQLPPLPVAPWLLPGPGGGAPLVLTFDVVKALTISGFAIAMLGAIESLLSAVVADGMSGHKHDPDAELLAQGIGNVLSPFFGGIAATGAIARTATNYRSGARSPISSFIHSLFVLLAVILLAPALGYLPMASLAALLLIVAWNMSEARHFLRMLRTAPKSDVTVLLICFGLTVVIDMVVAVTVGVLLAAVLFMRRMAEVSDVRLVGDAHHALDEPLPKTVLLYQIAGPFFFGSAQKAMSTLSRVQKGVRLIVLDVGAVPAMDATGLVNLQSAIAKLHAAGIAVVIAGLQHQPAKVLQKAGVKDDGDRLRVFASFKHAIEFARTHA